MLDSLYQDLKPIIGGLIKRKLIGKFDPRYKAIYGKFDKNIDFSILKVEKELDEYFKNNQKYQESLKQIPKEYEGIILEINLIDLSKEENFFENFKKTSFYILLIKEYFSQDEKFRKTFSQFEDSVKAFKKTYEIEVDNFINGKPVNLKLLDTYREFIMDELNNLIVVIETIIQSIVFDLYKKSIFGFLRNPRISSKKLNEIHQNINNFLGMFENKENSTVYSIGSKNLNSLLISNIDILR